MADPAEDIRILKEYIEQSTGITDFHLGVGPKSDYDLAKELIAEVCSEE